MTTLTEQAAAEYAEKKHTGFFGVSALCQHHEVPISKDGFLAGHQHCETHLLPEFAAWVVQKFSPMKHNPNVWTTIEDFSGKEFTFEQLLAKFKAEKNY